MRMWIALLLPILAIALGCGSVAPGAPIPDGGTGEPLADTGAPSRDLLSPGSGLRPAACGGVVQASGTAFGQPFDAGYVYAWFVGGDCTRSLQVTIAASQELEGTALTLGVRPAASDSRTFVGHAIQEVTIGSPLQRLQADVDVTAAPDVVELDQGVMSGSVTATFTIDVPDVSIVGSFSSPVCHGVYCI